MPSPYNTYVSPINRFQAIRGGRLANEGTAITNETRQIQNEQAQRGLAEYDKTLKTTNLAMDSLEVLQASPEARAQVIADKAANDTTGFWQGGQGKTSEQLEQMLKMNVQRGQMIGAIPATPERKIIKDAQGLNRYQDTGEQVFPGVEAKLGIDDVPSDIQVFEYVNKLPKEKQELWHKVKRGEDLSPKEEAEAAGLKQTAIEESKTGAAIKRRGTPGTAEFEEAELARNKAKKATQAVVSQFLDLRAGIAAGERIQKQAKSSTTGLTQAVLKFFPGSDQYDFEASVDSLKAKIALDSMMDLKAKSPTGSTGFGQLSEKELGVLQENIANLATSQSLDQFKGNLDIVLDRYRRTAGLIRLEYMEPADNIEDRVKQMKSAGLDDVTMRKVLSFENLGTPMVENLRTPIAEEEVNQETREVPKGMDPEDWKYMTPEDRALF